MLEEKTQPQTVETAETTTWDAAVVGAGYVGVPLAHTLASAGRSVLLIDISPDVVESLNRGESHIVDVPAEQLAPLVREGRIRATMDYNEVRRADPGNRTWTTKNVPKVIGGITPECTERAAQLYEGAVDAVHRVSTPEAAELTKLLENIFRSVNIALVNELAMLCDRMGIDIWEVVDAAATKPFGFMPFEPGPGMGGHCLPIDPFYLSFKAREYDLATEFIELAGKVNKHMPYFCIEKIERALNEAGKPVKGSRILLVGVSYKAGVGDLREAPAMKIIELLRARGAELSYHDPHIPELP